LSIVPLDRTAIGSSSGPILVGIDDAEGNRVAFEEMGQARDVWGLE
jgi:hypothetical protein